MFTAIVLVVAIALAYLSAYLYFSRRAGYIEQSEYVHRIAPPPVSHAYDLQPAPLEPVYVAPLVVEKPVLLVDPAPVYYEEPVIVIDEVHPIYDAVEELVEGDDIVVYGRGYGDVIETVDEIYPLADDTGEFAVYDNEPQTYQELDYRQDYVQEQPDYSQQSYDPPQDDPNRY